MDIEARPVKQPKLPLRSRLYDASIEWVARNRKWLPVWTKMLMLKMVRRKKGVEYMTLLCDSASKRSNEQIAEARKKLRDKGLL